MIVARVERPDVHDHRRAIALLRRQPRRAVADAIDIGGGPAALVGLDAHPVGAQREQLGGPAIGIAQDLDITIAVQQQMRRQRFE